jgi:preprotein translocase subunit SecE
MELARNTGLSNGRIGVRGAEQMKEFLLKLKNVFKNSVEFLKDTRKELHNVSWPGRREVTGTTVVVIFTVFFFGFFLFLVDQVAGTAINYILRLASK